MIYFHKTYQNVTGINNRKHYGHRIHKHCHFQNFTEINNINEIICVDKPSTIMQSNGFTPEELEQIREIILRPFLQTGGRKKHYRKTKKYYKKRKIPHK